MKGDGNGWAAGPADSRLWGLFGAAGLLLYAPTADRILLQHRAPWTASGGTWALPGGARDSHETPTAAALREAGEETGLDAALIDVLEEVVTAGPFPADPARPELAGGWTYTTVIASTATGEALPVTPNEESLELRWVSPATVEERPLLPAFAEAWPGLRARLRR